MDFNIEAHPLIYIIKVSIRVVISFLGMQSYGKQPCQGIPLSQIKQPISQILP